MSHAIPILQKLELNPTGIIHVGANDGQEVKAYKANTQCRPVLLIEPLPKSFAALTAKVADEPDFHLVQACCADESGRRVDFHIASNGEQSSSYLRPTGHLAVVPEITFDETIQVETITLDDLLADLSATSGVPSRRFDYLGMDTQGAEFDVLRGAGKTLPHLKFVFMEVSFGGIYDGDADVYTMIDFMHAQGFDLYNLEMKRRPWGDALFIRKGVLPRPD